MDRYKKKPTFFVCIFDISPCVFTQKVHLESNESDVPIVDQVKAVAQSLGLECTHH